MGATDIIVNIVCPLLGVLISNAMWLAPFKLVMQARESRHLGSVNPIPFAVTFINNIGWVMYASLLSNYYIFCSSVLGVLFALFYTITCLTIMAKEAYEDEFTVQYMLVEGLLVGGLLFWATLGIVQTSIFNAFADPHDQATVMIGYLCCFFNICYYAAPLSSMAEVIRTKDASSLYLPNILVNSLNATMWLCYGAFGVNNIVVWGPSLIGLLLSFSQMALVFAFHRGPWTAAVQGEATHQSIKVKSRKQGERTISFVISEGLSSKSRNLSVDWDPEMERLGAFEWSTKSKQQQESKKVRRVRYSDADVVCNPIVDNV